MADDIFVFNYIPERMLNAYRQAEKYSRELVSSDKIEIGNNYSDIINFENMLSSASYAALVFSDPQKREEVFKKMGGPSPLEWNVFNGSCSNEVRKLCENYSLGNREISENQLESIKEVCLTLEEYITFIATTKEEAEKEA